MKIATQILIVEDDPINLFLFKKFLADYETAAVTNSDDALIILEQRDFKVILMDINLGHNSMDGTTLMKHIKANSLTMAKIIACTAYAEKGDRDRFMAEGFDDYLSKPIKKEELLSIMTASIVA